MSTARRGSTPGSVGDRRGRYLAKRIPPDPIYADRLWKLGPFGVNLTHATPGSAQGLLLAVFDIETARQQLVASGIKASFSDPDGNGWRLQEVTTRLPGRIAGDTTYASVHDPQSAYAEALAFTKSTNDGRSMPAPHSPLLHSRGHT